MESAQMKVHAKASTQLALFLFTLLSCLTASAAEVPTYNEPREAFVEPDHAVWGEVPLWWWEGQVMTKEGVTAQLEKSENMLRRSRFYDQGGDTGYSVTKHTPLIDGP